MNNHLLTLRHLHPADVILSTADAAISGIIRVVTKSTISHSCNRRGSL